MKMHLIITATVLIIIFSATDVWSQNIFVVNSTSDGADVSPGNGTCFSTDGVCSLRAAIEEANALTNQDGPDRILFTDTPFSNGTALIELESDALPEISDAVLIDGGTASGEVVISGANIPAIIGATATLGLSFGLGSAGSTVRGLTIGNGFYYAIYADRSHALTIADNFIGTDSQGNDLGNRIGVGITRSSDTIVRNNTIGYHSEAGILLLYNVSTDVVQGNYIGVNASGRALGAMLNGVMIWYSNNVTVGGAAAGTANVVGYCHTGILVQEGEANKISGNYIGTNERGERFGNQVAGIHLLETKLNVVGGERGNVFGFNGVGLLFDTTMQNQVAGNYFGVMTDGADVGNLGAAIQLMPSAHGNQIGMDLSTPINGNASLSNIIAMNGGGGIQIEAGDPILGYPMQNTLRGNRIYNNEGLGIDLGNDGRDQNDPGDMDAGANRKQNYPEIQEAVFTDQHAGIMVTYLLSSGSAHATYPLTVDFYLSSTEANGQAQAFLGSDSYETPGSIASLELAHQGGAFASEDLLVAMATDGKGNTSEISLPFSPSLATAVEELQSATAGSFAVSPVYPNPFSNQTNFTVDIGEQGPVRITVHDMLGRQVALVYDGPLSGRRAFTFDAAHLAPGAYMLRVHAGDAVETRRLVLIR